jgi:hypothetical protein
LTKLDCPHGHEELLQDIPERKGRMGGGEAVALRNCQKTQGDRTGLFGCSYEFQPIFPDVMPLH